MTEGELSQCQWPDLAPPYAAALRAAMEFVFHNFEPRGILATGSIVRGADDPRSDLDICMAHGQPFMQRLPRRFGGVTAEIFVNPPVSIRRYFVEEQKWDSERIPVKLDGESGERSDVREEK